MPASPRAVANERRNSCHDQSGMTVSSPPFGGTFCVSGVLMSEHVSISPPERGAREDKPRFGGGVCLYRIALAPRPIPAAERSGLPLPRDANARGADRRSSSGWRVASIHGQQDRDVTNPALRPRPGGRGRLSGSGSNHARPGSAGYPLPSTGASPKNQDRAPMRPQHICPRFRWANLWTNRRILIILSDVTRRLSNRLIFGHL